MTSKLLYSAGIREGLGLLPKNLERWKRGKETTIVCRAQALQRCKPKAINCRILARTPKSRSRSMQKNSRTANFAKFLAYRYEGETGRMKREPTLGDEGFWLTQIQQTRTSKLGPYDDPI